MSAETLWFYARNWAKEGPVPESQLRELLARGEIQPSTLVWTQGMTQWQPLAETPLAASGTAFPPPLIPAPGPLPTSAVPTTQPAGEATATVALVCSCLGLAGIFCCGTSPLAIVGVLIAHINLASSAATQRARERSRAALIVGYSALVIYALIIVVVLVIGGMAEAIPHWLRNVRPGWPA